MDKRSYCVCRVAMMCVEEAIVCAKVAMMCVLVAMMCVQVAMMCVELRLSHCISMKKNCPYSNIFYSILLYTLIFVSRANPDHV